MVSAKIVIQGRVQGVGFRPQVWRLAKNLNIYGWIRNCSEGVEILAQNADKIQIQRFLEALLTQSPEQARVDGYQLSWLSSGPILDAFSILESQSGSGTEPVRVEVSPDLATCPACLAEIDDPSDRRYQYPFTNCTDCGPRVSIIHQAPYDRESTSMASFTMCPACQDEYENPADRRFHAQPNACPTCGPVVWLESCDGSQVSRGQQAITDAAEALKGGKIVSIKGVGGVHLAVSACQANAINRLRARKSRPHKPLAVMFKNIGQVRQYAQLSGDEENILSRAEAPILLVRKRVDQLPEVVAPGNSRIGVMLPNSPLHHLLMEQIDFPIVLTSGNRSGNPQVITNQDAREQLSQIADLHLLHDRDIVNRMEDSVLRLDVSGPSILRRARGYAPASIPLSPGFEMAAPVLGLGAELKSTFCLLQAGRVILSQHIGELHNPQTLMSFERQLSLYSDLYQIEPKRLSCDLHPGYHSTHWAEVIAAQAGLPLIKVQHHHAHAAACLGENGWSREAGKVLCWVLDGAGLGADTTIWGGELLLADYQRFERLEHLPQVPQLGGNAAAIEPWRNLLSHLWSVDLDAETYTSVPEQSSLNLLRQTFDKRINAPLSSSVGRLFDAVAALLGIIPERQSFEGQAGIALESLASPVFREFRDLPYPIFSQGQQVDLGVFWRALIAAFECGAEPAEIAARFHATLVDWVVKLSLKHREQIGVNTVALSGGVLQNALLKDEITRQLSTQGFRVLNHRVLPANDGCISFGQVLVASAHP